MFYRNWYRDIGLSMVMRSEACPFRCSRFHRSRWWCVVGALHLAAACSAEPDEVELLSGSADVGIALDAGASSADAAADTLDAQPIVDGGVLGEGQVRIESGVVEGVTVDDVYVFKGVPFAAPPVAGRRFRPPEPVLPWDGVRPALDFGPVCPQRNRQGQFVGDEDCLQLNIWGDLETEAPKPVMVWIHGGGFVQGSSSVAIYDGARLARDGDVVVVSINYRLGALGFLAVPELIDENPSATAGNYGILDQIHALRWVRDNISGFGGDPGRVTIFGESAGGASVCALLAAPAAAGLFHRAVIQSGGGCYAFPMLEGGRGESALDIGDQYVTAAGCELAADRLACLRELTAAALTDALFNISTSGLGLPDVGPVIDGVVLPEPAFDAFSRGHGNRVPILIGSNRDETVSFNARIQVPDRATFEALVAVLVGRARSAEVAGLYSELEYPDPKDAYNAFSSDISFNCSAEAFARAAQGAPVYLYAFEQELSGQLGAQGVLHGQEIAFVFGTLSTIPAYRARVEDDVLSAQMLAAWSSFARTGVPMLSSPAWPPFEPEAASIMTLASPRVLRDEYRKGRCEELRRLGLIPG